MREVEITISVGRKETYWSSFECLLIIDMLLFSLGLVPIFILQLCKVITFGWLVIGIALPVMILGTIFITKKFRLLEEY